MNLKSVVDKNRSSDRAVKSQVFKGKQFSDAPMIDRIDFDHKNVFCDGSVSATLSKYAISKLTAPNMFTVRDLHGIVVSQLSGAPTSDWQEPLIRIIGHVIAELGVYWDEQLEGYQKYSLGRWETGEAHGVPYGETLWTSSNGFQFVVFGDVVADSLTGNHVNLNGSFYGWATWDAIRDLQNDFERASDSLFKTMHYICQSQHSHSETCEHIEFFNSDGPSVETLFSDSNKHFFQQCVDSFFLQSEKKTESLEQRLRNCIHLLVEADAQTS
ncbi:MAG: hypothetical protein O3B68_17715, partial [Planctomycetota bacterium]|nr:hypothetical protein [Planctomycetota bacterium]